MLYASMCKKKYQNRIYLNSSVENIKSQICLISVRRIHNYVCSTYSNVCQNYLDILNRLSIGVSPMTSSDFFRSVEQEYLKFSGNSVGQILFRDFILELFNLIDTKKCYLHFYIQGVFITICALFVFTRLCTCKTRKRTLKKYANLFQEGILKQFFSSKNIYFPQCDFKLVCCNQRIFF